MIFALYLLRDSSAYFDSIEHFDFMSILHSPLLMVMHDPVLHQFISYLAEKKAEQEANPDSHTTIELSRDLMGQVRESFRQNILDGERNLHLLSHLLSTLLLEDDFELHSNVIGLLPSDEDQAISHSRTHHTRHVVLSDRY
jgi:hypothetical protein